MHIRIEPIENGKNANFLILCSWNDIAKEN